MHPTDAEYENTKESWTIPAFVGMCQHAHIAPELFDMIHLSEEVICQLCMNELNRKRRTTLWVITASGCVRLMPRETALPVNSLRSQIHNIQIILNNLRETFKALAP